MTALPREVTNADIAGLLESIDKAAKRVGYAGRGDVLSLDELSRDTGIPQGRLLELLTGAEPEQPPRGAKEREAYYRRLVGQRLSFLRKRARPNAPHGEATRDIGDELQVSNQLIAHLSNGTRSSKEEYGRALEARYGVEHGFLSKPEGLALAERLVKIRDGLVAGALHQQIMALGGERAALRHTGEEPPTLETLLEIMDAVIAQRQAADQDGQ